MTFLIAWLLLTASFVAVYAWAALHRPMRFLYLLPFTALAFATGIHQLADSLGLFARLALALLGFCLAVWATCTCAPSSPNGATRAKKKTYRADGQPARLAILSARHPLS